MAFGLATEGGGTPESTVQFIRRIKSRMAGAGEGARHSAAVTAGICVIFADCNQFLRPVAVQKFAKSNSPSSGERTSEPKPHYKLIFASVPLNPKFAPNVPQNHANVGFRTCWLSVLHEASPDRQPDDQSRPPNPGVESPIAWLAAAGLTAVAVIYAVKRDDDRHKAEAAFGFDEPARPSRCPCRWRAPASVAAGARRRRRPHPLARLEGHPGPHLKEIRTTGCCRSPPVSCSIRWWRCSRGSRRAFRSTRCSPMQRPSPTICRSPPISSPAARSTC